MPGQSHNASLDISTSSNNHTGLSGIELLSMQDIDRISKELILPSLNMTKSTSFTPNFMSHGSPLDNPLRAAGSHVINKGSNYGSYGVEDNPYGH